VAATSVAGATHHSASRLFGHQIYGLRWVRPLYFFFFEEDFSLDDFESDEDDEDFESLDLDSDDFDDESPLDLESEDDDPDSDDFESPPDFESPEPPSLLPLPGLFPL
jgi:hypothetical protein